jgi:hypothetical protein
MMRYLLFALITGLLAAGPTRGQDIDRLQQLGQEQFRLLSEDLGGALSYHPQTPTEPLGVTGFDIGISVTFARLKNQAVFQQASSETVDSTLPVPTLRVHKGLPFGFDIGAIYASIPDSNIRYYGAELRYAIVQGGPATPALGLRGSFTKLTGVDQLDLDTRGLDLSISKGIGFITPYAGAGKVWVESDPNGIASLSSEDFTLNKVFAGVGVNLAGLNINLEADRTGDVQAYSLKLGLRF